MSDGKMWEIEDGFFSGGKLGRMSLEAPDEG